MDARVRRARTMDTGIEEAAAFGKIAKPRDPGKNVPTATNDPLSAAASTINDLSSLLLGN